MYSNVSHFVAGLVNRTIENSSNTIHNYYCDMVERINVPQPSAKRKSDNRSLSSPAPQSNTLLDWQDCQLCSTRWDNIGILDSTSTSRHTCGNEFHNHCLSRWIRECNIRRIGTPLGDQLQPVKCPSCRLPLQTTLQQQMITTLISVLHQSIAQNKVVIKTIETELNDTREQTDLKDALNHQDYSALVETYNAKAQPEKVKEEYSDLLKGVMKTIPDLLETISRSQPENANAISTFASLYSLLTLYQYAAHFKEFPVLPPFDEVISLTSLLPKLRKSQSILETQANSYRLLLLDLTTNGIKVVGRKETMQQMQLALESLTSSFAKYVLICQKYNNEASITTGADQSSAKAYAQHAATSAADLVNMISKFAHGLIEMIETILPADKQTETLELALEEFTQQLEAIDLIKQSIKHETFNELEQKLKVSSAPNAANYLELVSIEQLKSDFISSTYKMTDIASQQLSHPNERALAAKAF